MTGFIEESVVISATCGDENFYKEAYTTAQNIGYGVCDPSRDMSNETITFTVAGQVIENPVDLIATETE